VLHDGPVAGRVASERHPRRHVEVRLLLELEHRAALDLERLGRGEAVAVERAHERRLERPRRVGVTAERPAPRERRALLEAAHRLHEVFPAPDPALARP